MKIKKILIPVVCIVSLILVYLLLASVLYDRSQFQPDFREMLGIKAYKIPSGGMIPTILPGDHILVDLDYARNTDPQKGVIVVFKSPEDPAREFIQRIIAIGGDKVQMINKQVYINDNLIQEPYVQYTDNAAKAGQLNPRDNFGPYLVPKDKYFMMGDNRDNSSDSRVWGYVDRKLIRGKPMFIYWARDLKRIGSEIK
jgi:signal peptidase I